MAKKNQVKQTLAVDEHRPLQPLKEQINPKAKPFKDTADTQVKWRYACPMCTNVAFKSVKKEVGNTDKICASCGKKLPELVEANYIKL